MPPAALLGIYFALRREDFTLYGQKHGGEGQYTVECILPPMFSSPASALGVLPSIALSSELAAAIVS